MGRIRDWVTIQTLLPEDLAEGEMRLLKSYYRAQLKIVHGQKKKAGKLLDRLDNICGFQDLEENRGELFKVIDLAVRGETNRDTSKIGY